MSTKRLHGQALETNDVIDETAIVHDHHDHDHFHGDGHHARADGSEIAPTGIRNIDALIQGSKWGGDVSYGFPPATGYLVGADPSEPSLSGFSRATERQKEVVRAILECVPAKNGDALTMTAVEQFTHLELTEADRPVDRPDIRIANGDEGNPSARAYFPAWGGDVWFGNQHNYLTPELGSLEYRAVIHELGHSLGLKHGHEPGGIANTATSPDRDSHEFSVMTYRSSIDGPIGYTNDTYSHPQSFMMYDIAALQHLYGANFDSYGTEMVYSWHPWTSETFINGEGQGKPGGSQIFLTVWDGSGNATYDFSSYGTTLSIDLRPGYWTTLDADQTPRLAPEVTARGSIFNALQYEDDPRSLIKNVIGGLGDDIIVANSADNVLTGGGGTDTFVFYPDFGNNIITDFQPDDGDIIEFRDMTFDLDLVLEEAIEIDTGVLLTIEEQGSITLNHVALANLHADDFRLVA